MHESEPIMASGRGEWPLGGVMRILAGVCLLGGAGCSLGGGGGVDARAASAASLVKAQDAALTLYDALAPAFGAVPKENYPQSLGGQIRRSDACEARYTAEALIARCVLFRDAVAVFEKVGAGDDPVALSAITTLQDDGPRLFALGRAAQVNALQEHDFEWLAALDDIFGVVAQRAPPRDVAAARAFSAIAARVEAMLARSEPAYGADSLYEVMDQGEVALTAADLPVLEGHVAAAEAALRRFDAAADDWRAMAAVLADYDAMLRSALRVRHRGVQWAEDDPVRRYASALLDRLGQLRAIR